MSSQSSITLLHASDFHIKSDEDDSFARRYIERGDFVFDAKRMMKKVGVPTALILSGDVAFKGGSKEYTVANKMISNILLELDLPKERVLVVPGNHDVDRKIAAKLDARMLRDQLRAFPDDKAEEIFRKNRTKLLEPLDAFQKFAMAYDCLIVKEDGYWEISNDEETSAGKFFAADFDITIRGISTVHASDRSDDYMEFDNPEEYGSHMFVARAQLHNEQLDQSVKEPLFRLLIGHHPPDCWLHENNRTSLLKNRHHLHLYGHVHQFAPTLEGNAVRVISGAINPEVHPDQPARYNWIKISKSKDGFLVRIWSRIYDNEEEDFVEDPEWPGGKGFLISSDLSAPPAEIHSDEPDDELPKPDRQEVPMIKQKEPPHNEQELAARADIPVVKKAPLNPETVRYHLLTKGPLFYEAVFHRLDMDPTEAERLVLGGLEYYEEKLEGMLKTENIDRLAKAMLEEGFDVYNT